jgi:hypothetical protein
MSDSVSMQEAVSYSTNGALRILGQGDLLGEAYRMPVLNGGGRKKRARKQEEQPKPGFATALKLVVQLGREKAKEVGKTALSRCPRCGHVGPTEQDFGTRVIRGERRPQSWCRNCRKTNLPPLKALPHADRKVKATLVETANEKPAKAQRPRAVPPLAPVPATQDGWLFPPDALGKRKRRKS